MSKNFWRLAALIMILAVCMSLAPLPATAAGETDTLGFTPYRRISAGYLYSLAVRPDAQLRPGVLTITGSGVGKTDSRLRQADHALALKQRHCCGVGSNSL